MNRENEIRKVAYELYERSGMIPGREVENWIKAEKIVMARYAERAKTAADAPPAKKAVAKTKTPKTEPVKTEPVKTGKVKAEPGKAGQKKASPKKK